MPDIPVATALLERTTGDWSILAEIAQMDERDRRALLRFHREGGFVDSQQIDQRDRLDEALYRLTLRELGIEVGVLEGDGGLATVPHLFDLFASSAFVRYADAYLSLSMRFVADRLAVPVPPRNGLNELPVPRPSPPSIETAHVQSAGTMIERFLALEQWLTFESDVRAAQDFLDDFIILHDEPLRFELWLRGLSGQTDQDVRFQAIARGMIRLAREKAHFYAGMEEESYVAWKARGHARGALSARNPLTARFGLFDLYWLARLLRAEVSPSGAVTYADGSWLSLLGRRAQEIDAGITSDDLCNFEEMLTSVLDYACDLVQNSADIVTAYLEAASAPERPERPPTTWGWRQAFDEELSEVARQRRERRGTTSDLLEVDPTAALKSALGQATAGVTWSHRVRTGEHVSELVGLALSGGGIRSATFSLGILQRLQELDILRKVDYLSTVSGGGYIGSWLIANVYRTRYWLTQPTDWGRSIAHLRRFSNYLSPRTGILSADTWTMWGSWLRNTFLIQLSAVAWLSLLMVVVGAGGVLFQWHPSPAEYNTVLGTAICAAMVALTVVIYASIRREDTSLPEDRIQQLIVVPAMAGGVLTSAVLWMTRNDIPSAYGGVITYTLGHWFAPLLVLSGGYFLLAWRSAEGRGRRVLLGVLSALFSTAANILVACGVWWMYRQMDGASSDYVWFAYTFGPSLILLSATVGVGIMIGVLGLDSRDWRREWWTRLGSWLGIYAAGYLAISIATVFGPWIILRGVVEGLWSTPWTTWSAVLGWIGTVIGGLMAGNSTRSDGERATSRSAQFLSGFARFSAVVFIVGALFLVATLVHLVLANLSDVDAITDGHKYWLHLQDLKTSAYLWSALVLAVVGWVASKRFDLNVFGLNQFYRNRLVRCYLGATRWVPGLRKPHRFTGFDPDDDVELSALRQHPLEPAPFPFRGPFPIVNGALNLGGSSDLALHTRHSTSFTMTPLRCGADRATVGFAPTAAASIGSFAGGVTLGQAVSISGAAASPNMGYDTSPVVAFLMTMFNVRLGWWFPNPGRKEWLRDRLGFGLLYLIRETFGLADETSRFVNVSDGGHFENLGIYELVRRRCKVIIACDGECDDQLTFGSLGRVIRMCRTDFGANIDIDVESIRRNKETGLSRAHCAVGRITYANGSRGYLIYLKASITGDEDVGVQQYRASHAEFPHETTADQFFAEDQFESYRKLGHHVATMTFRGAEDRRNVAAMAARLDNIWVAESAASSDFVDRTQGLIDLWERMRSTPGLLALFRELHGLPPSPAPTTRSTDEELVVCLQLIQLMENAFFELRLDEHWTHPDNRGWTVLFTMWARSDTFRAAWQRYKNVFGIRFCYFCEQRLGL